MNDVLSQVLADLTAEGDRLEALVAELDEAGWHTPTPARGWDVAAQVAHLAWTDEVALKAATDKDAWDAVVLAAINDPNGYVDEGAAGVARGPDLRHAVAYGPARAGHRAGRPSRRREDAVVRPADVSHVDGHSPADGDVGAQPRRPRGVGPRWRTPTGSATSPTSASAPATSPSPSTASTHLPRSSASTSSRRRKRSGPGVLTTPRRP